MSSVDQFWRAFLRSRPDLGPETRYYEAFCFGNTARMADELAALVRHGVKTATSALLWEYEAKGKAIQREGDFSIVLDATHTPACIIQTTELRIVPFGEVDEEFAYDYGEGDRTLAWWRRNLWEYYAAECASLGRPAHEEMPLICERFQIVFTDEI